MSSQDASQSDLWTNLFAALSSPFLSSAASSALVNNKKTPSSSTTSPSTTLSAALTRHQYTLQEKLDRVLEFHQLLLFNKNLSAAKYAKNHGINKRTFADWLQQHEQGVLKPSIVHADERYRIREGEYLEVEELLVAYIHERQALYARDKLGLSYFLLQRKAMEFASIILPPEALATSQASDGWVYRVLFRYGLHQIKVFGEAGQVDVVLANTQMEVSRKYLTELTCQEGLTLDMIFNADQTGLLFRQLPNSLFARKKMRLNSAALSL
jgi:hypothetical protein